MFIGSAAKAAKGNRRLPGGLRINMVGFCARRMMLCASTPAEVSRRTARLLYQFLAMNMDERSVNRSPGAMLDTFHWFRGEGFQNDRRGSASDAR
jgi:hypothetical protein